MAPEGYVPSCVQPPSQADPPWLGKKVMIARPEVSLDEGNAKGFYYSLDLSSVWETAPLAMLSSRPRRCLDMCAAPGGKTLSIALRLKGSGELIANDRSPDRRSRLKTVIEECLEEKYRKNIKVTGYDASSWCLYEREAYDAVLLDAPCSSERHVFLDPKHLSIWSPSRPKRLAKEQYALLSSAFITLKKGGYLLYSTCSINPCENQDVISRLFDRHSDEVEEIETEIHAAEHMQHGLMIMPDRTDGLGPMYACLLRKKQ